jgi:hypothetical protein
VLFDAHAKFICTGVTEGIVEPLAAGAVDADRVDLGAVDADAPAPGAMAVIRTKTAATVARLNDSEHNLRQPLIIPI